MTRLLTPHRQNVLLVALACAVLPPVTAEAMPRLLPGSLAITLAIGVSLAIAALSFNLLLGYAGQLSLGHAALLGVGAFAASIAVDRMRLPMPFGWLLAAAAGGLIALVVGIPALRLRGLYLAIVTMIFGLTLQASLLRWPFFTRGSAGVALPRRLYGDHLLTDPAVYLSVTLLLLLGVWLVDRNVLRSRLGRAFRMIREDETAAQAFGIDVTRTKLIAFVIAGATAGLAGAAYGSAIGLVNSDVFPLDLSLRIVLFVIIGGIGRRWGAALVAVLLSLSPELPLFLRGWDLVVAGAIVLYNVVRLPGGLAGLVSELLEGRRLSSAAMPLDDDEPVLSPDLAAVRPTSTRPRPAGDQPVLRVIGLSVSFGGLRALDDVSLEVRPAEIVGIIGPNGAGKSTLFNAISGFTPTLAGRVDLDGRPIHELAPHQRARRGLGRTFQHVGLARDMSVLENILLAQHRAATYGDVAALVHTGRVDSVERSLAELADGVVAGLGFGPHDRDKLVGRLSGGQQRLVELAAVLATDPEILMLDEPTAGLSPAAAENLADRLRALRDEQGQSILLIEHNVPVVLDLCDRVYVLNAGALLAEGTPAELGRNPEILRAYLGEVLA